MGIKSELRNQRQIVLSNLPALINRWVLQLMLDGVTLKKSSIASQIDMEQVTELLGDAIDSIPVDEFGDPKPEHVVSLLQHKLKEQLSEPYILPATFDNNVSKMGQAVGLNEVEQRVLAFAVLLQAYRSLYQAADRIKVNGRKDLAHRISKLIDCPEVEVAQALAKTGRLHQTGLVTFSFNSLSDMANSIELLNNENALHLVEQPCEPMDWLMGLIEPGKAAELTWEDFAHVAKPLAVLRTYLRQALTHKRTGVNVFVYGVPGTGKTQLARLLAQDLQTQLYELSLVDENDRPIGPEKRLKTMGAMNNILANSQGMTLVDEVEEIFFEGSNFVFLTGYRRSHSGGGHSQKAWINRQLESNALPTVWVSNSLNGMDPAFVRRFDMVLELPVPPLGQRLRLVQQLAGHLLTPAHAKQFADCEHLAPAVLTRAMGVVQSIDHELPAHQQSEALHMLVNNTLKAQQHGDLSRYKTGLPELYDPRFVNTTADLSTLARHLADVRSARICLYGLPGTGKTAFARWLADQLDMPLLVKRASDLLSKYLGESEQNIARAFEQAQADNAVLLIDEVDSFLQQREGAQRSWEVTQVNEMLTQMESFEGVFLASTNLMQGMDPAALRRFDIKLNFLALRPDQAATLLAQYCQQFGLDAPSVADMARLGAIKQLTPGDFAAVARRQRLLPLPSPDHWIGALKEECQLKPNHSNHAGFL